MLNPTHQSIAINTDESLFEKIANALTVDGYCIMSNALPVDMARSLALHAQSMQEEKFDTAGIGRSSDFGINQKVRRDEICWITGDSIAGRHWLNWCESLQSYLNQRLFLGLFSFESHFARYQSGAFYHRHLDAFKGQTNRVLSLVTYLNEDWGNDDGGELVLYADEKDTQGMKVAPQLGTLAIFLSEEFPHEVLPANRERLSIAGWFRVNTSNQNHIDPPR